MSPSTGIVNNPIPFEGFLVSGTAIGDSLVVEVLSAGELSILAEGESIVDELLAEGVIGAWATDSNEDSVETVRRIRESMWRRNW